MKEQSTFKGFAILSAATMAVKILSLIYNPFLIQILAGDRPFAIYSATYQIYVFIYVITNTGIPSAISKLISEFSAVKNYRAAVRTFRMARTILIAVGVVMSILMLLIAAPLTSFMQYPEAKLSVIALCPAVFFTSVASAYKGYFQGRGNMKPTAVSQVLEQIINTIFSLLFAYILIKKSVVLGCVGATIGTTLGAVVSSSYLFVMYSRNNIKIKIESTVGVVKYRSKQLFNRIIKYSVPITICIGVTNLGAIIDTSNTNNRLLAAGFSLFQAQALSGTLAKFNVLINVPITVICALAAAILPAVSRAVALKDRELAKRKINFGFRLCFIISIPAAVGLTVLSKPIFMLLYSRYLDGYKLLLYGSVVLVLMSVVQIQTSIIQGIGKLYTVTVYSILGILIKLLTNYIAIANRSININGAIIGSILGLSIPLFLNSRYIKTKLKFKINMRRLWMKPLVASLFMGVILYFSYNLIHSLLQFVLKGYLNNAIATVIAIILGMLTYGFSMLYLKGITSEEIAILPARVRKLIPGWLL